jgi:hypothetical protein
MQLDLHDLLDPEIIPVLFSFPFFIRNKRLLLIGAGGGGDVCGVLPMYYWIKQLGGFPILGSLTWERTIVFKGYGPRKFTEIDGLNSIHNTVAWGGESTSIKTDGTLFQATRIAEVLHEPITFLDISKGPTQLAKDLDWWLHENKIDMIIPIDVGGDIIARGSETGLQSPLADAIILATIKAISWPKMLGIFGLNCDGELKLAELRKYIQEFNRREWVLGVRRHIDPELKFMEETIRSAGAITEASMQPLRYWHGERGPTTIRKGTRQVMLDEDVLNTYFFDLDQIYSKCPIAQLISTCTSIEEANERLLADMHLNSEYEREKRKLID